MPALRHRQQTLSAELQAIADRTNDRAAFLRLAETLTAFLARLRSAAETLSVIERQKIVRLLVKDVLVGDDTITIRHSIPIPSGSPQNGGSDAPNGQNYLLCKRRDNPALRNTLLPRRFQQQFEQPHNLGVVHSACHLLQYEGMSNRIEVGTQVEINDIGHVPHNCLRDALNRSVG